MDFIPELPLSDGFDNILVILDKLTKYAIFIPTTTTITEVGTAKLFSHNIISKFGIPWQVIMDRDVRWRGEFWKEICNKMGMTRSLTTAYHPQADGQTQVLNQSLETSLQSYIGPSRDDLWCILKDLSQSIHKAADPDVDPFESLPSYLNPSHLRELEIPSPRILQIKNFSQNMLLSSTTIEEVHHLFNMAQAIGVETVEWIAEAKKRCGSLRWSHGWNWSGEERLDSDRFPLLEGQLLISEPTLEPSDSNALILHPHYLNQARAQASAVFLLPTQFSQPLAYPSTNYDADINLANAIRNMNIAE